MSLNEEIAKLTGVLNFKVDTRGLQQFQQKMQQAHRSLEKLTRGLEGLSQKLSKSLKVKIDTSDIDKTQAKIDRALNRQARAHAALQNQQRQTFSAELTQQKLKYAGSKAQAILDSTHLQSKKEGAIIAAKAAAAQAKLQGATSGQLSTQNQLTASLTKQAKLAAILQKTQAASQKATQQHALAQGKLQQIQQKMATATQQAQQKSQQSAQQHAAKLAAAQQIAANRTQNSQQSAQRFQMAQQRHAAWQARQNAPTSGMFGSGVSGAMAIGGAIGGIGVAIAGISSLINRLGERIEKRQESAVGAETFNSRFTAISPDTNVQRMWRDFYLKSSVDNGSPIDADSATDYRNFVMAQLAYNKTPEQIMKAFDLRQKAFLVGGASRADAKEMNKQLGQMASDGTGSKQDYDIINDRMPMMAPYLVRAYGEENGITDRQKALTQFNKDLKGGKGVKYSWYERAMELMVSENKQALDDRKGTIAYAKQQQENQSFLNDNAINTNAELSAAMRDNIQAHRELNDALQPAAASLREFDEGLTRAQSSLIRFLVGRNEDGSVKAPEQIAQDSARAGMSDAPLIDISALTGAKPSTGTMPVDPNRDPVNRFWNWIFGKNPSTQGSPEQESLGAPGPSMTSLMPGIIPQVKLASSSLSSLQTDNSGALSQFGNFIQSMQGMQATMERNSGIPAASTTINAPITVEGAQVSVTINGSNVDDKLKAELTDLLTTEINKTNRSIPGIAQGAANNVLRDTFGMARAQQAERY